MSLTNQQVEQFINDGYLKVEQAFSRQLAGQCREMLWADIGYDPEDKSTCQKPVVWLGEYAQAPFVEAATPPSCIKLSINWGGGKLETEAQFRVFSGYWRPSNPVLLPTCSASTPFFPSKIICPISKIYPPAFGAPMRPLIGNRYQKGESYGRYQHSTNT